MPSSPLLQRTFVKNSVVERPVSWVAHVGRTSAPARILAVTALDRRRGTGRSWHRGPHRLTRDPDAAHEVTVPYNSSVTAMPGSGEVSDRSEVRTTKRATRPRASSGSPVW